MARKVFFSFHHQNDIFEVNQIRNSWRFRSKGTTQPFVDRVEFEKLKRQGDRVVQNWIDRQMVGCGVLVVLIGPYTYQRRWVRYEIEKAYSDRMGIIGVSLHGMRRPNSILTKAVGPSPFEYAKVGTVLFKPEFPIYSWIGSDGQNNMGKWIDSAAKKVGR